MSAVRSRVAAAGALALALSAGYLAQGTFAAGGTPANKVAASGSTLEIIGANNKVALLTETVKINNPTDLIISATAECSIITQVKTQNGTAEALGRVKMWVEIDGKPVPVSADDVAGALPGDPTHKPGQVVFCNRDHQQESKLNDMDDDQNDGYFTRTYLDTREANGFNWMALNVGTNYPGTENNTHEVVLWAEFLTATSTSGSTTQVPNTAMAKAAVGNRTLVLEPVKAANGETVTIN